MGNRRVREFMLRQSDEKEWHRARTQPRPATKDVHARGIGVRRLQLVVCPSFEPGFAWEVRQRQGAWHLTRSAVMADLQLLGCEELEAEPEGLARFYARVAGLTLPLAPDLSGMAGCDGTTHQLAVFGDLWSGWRFQWWTEYPRQWQALVDLAGEMFEVFSAAQPVHPS